MTVIRRLLALIRRFLVLAGIFYLALLSLAFTSFPWNWYKWMAQPGVNASGKPDFIVMMGGGGIPSESGLMRSWKAAEAATLYPESLVIVAMPEEADAPSNRVIERELVMRGVAESRLLREDDGRNTHEQAVGVFTLLKGRVDAAQVRIGLVTSPEHMRRTWLCFERAGFSNLIAIPSWPEAIKADLTYGQQASGPPRLSSLVGGSLTLRYRFWDNLGLINRCAHECIAILYYRLVGWI